MPIDGNRRILNVSSAPPEAISMHKPTLSRAATFTRMGDCELLEHFANRAGANDESAERAFATLVERHGPMVLRVCRSGLGNWHEAEDAFQATFLVLAQRAGSIRRSRSVGSWLHGVALRVAACARLRAARRQHHERKHAATLAKSAPVENQSPALDAESGRVVNEEINRLPERFRSAVVLCYLEGLTHELAADQLGCPVGTVRSRLATGRDRLRRRLTRRGLTPVGVPPGGSSPEPALSPLTVPTALADGTVRGALHVGLGKTALAGIVSAEAVALVNGAAKTWVVTKLVWGTTALVAGLAIAGVGVSRYSAKWRRGLPAGAQVDDSRQTDPRDSPSAVGVLLRESRAGAMSFWKAEQQAKSPEDRRQLVLEHQKKLDSYAQKLFQIAEINRGTPLAEEALIGIVFHLQSSTNAERAIEIITRDHITSETIEPLFHRSGLFITHAAEKLYREALAKSPHRQIQGLACYSLARYLEVQTATFVHRQGLTTASSVTAAQRSTENEAEREGARERLREHGPHALDGEAIALYERLVNEFGDIPAGEPLPNLVEDEYTRARRASLGEIAEIYLADLRDHGVGKSAPEIEGVDLDGRPMKLSDYRGKVVVLYFGAPVAPGGVGAHAAAPVTAAVDEIARRHAGDPLAILGVSTVNPGPSAGREAYQWALKASKLPARFWWDLEPPNRPGPIQTAWNARGRVRLYVLDHRGVIRETQYSGPELLEKAIAQLLKEQKEELGKAKNNN
jgi:RNA polymerase sigma factor (sigma-70 family)